MLDTAGHDFETTLDHIHKSTRSELSHAACHSRLELRTAQALDHNPKVLRWVRNFGIGWTIPYYVAGIWRRYTPDFVAVLDGGVHLIIECKGAWDNKALQAEKWTREHWIPSVAGTVDLPDSLRRWDYGIIDDPKAVGSQLSQLISKAQQEGSNSGD